MHVTHSRVVSWVDVESKCWLITQIICHQQSQAQTHNTEDTSSFLLPSCLVPWTEVRCDPTVHPSHSDPTMT